MRPLLRWAGSKRQLLPKLATYWGDSHKRYIEPFAGSACLYFALQPSHAVLGDVNDDLIEMYDTTRMSPRAVYFCLRAMERGEDAYYRIRSMNPSQLTPVQRASRFIYLNRFCFNGLYRTNQSGKFNVPYGGYRSGEVPSWREFQQFASLLQTAELVPLDFEDTVTKAERGDLVYLDPPYAVNGRRVFREYGAKCFSPDDFVRLAETLRGLSKRGIHFVVSYADCPEARLIFKEWHICQVTAQRNIAGFSKHRRKDAELLVSNFLPSDSALAGQG